MRKPRSARKVVRRRIAGMTIVACAAGLVAGLTASAGAAPAPTVGQVQARLSALQSKSAKLDQQYDQVKEELGATNQRLDLVKEELGKYSSRFDVMQLQIARIAITAYEDGNISSSIALLTSGNPQQVLNQSSILLELSASNDAQINEFLAAARQLTATQRLAVRTRAGVLQLRNNLAKRVTLMNKLVSQEQSLLDQLTPAQQTGLGPGSGSTGGIKYTGPETTQAEKAVAFAYAALGCPYVYGGTGPCSDGYDCSGLTMAAWASAGVSIPRTSYAQESELPQVDLAGGDPTKYLEPGDILGFIGNGHVGIYVGHGELIDAPVPGEDVELIPLSGWYLANLDGAVRP